MAFFPQLQAGPIERGRQLIPQLSRPRVVNIDQFSRGAYLIVLGFFKKVAIADGVAPIVDQIFASTGRVTFIDVVVGSVLFAVQIYCDFSGYTDIARGMAKLMGIELMVNFDHTLFCDESPGLLAPLAYQFVYLAPGLSLSFHSEVVMETFYLYAGI